jgi:hypothetical protein
MLRLILIASLPLLLSGCIGAVIQITAQAALQTAAEAAAIERAKRNQRLASVPDESGILLNTVPANAQCKRIGEERRDNTRTEKSPSITLNTNRMTNTITCIADGYAPAKVTFIGMLERYSYRGSFSKNSVYLNDYLQGAVVHLTPTKFASEAEKEAHSKAWRTEHDKRTDALNSHYWNRFQCGDDEEQPACSDYEKTLNQASNEAKASHTATLEAAEIAPGS